MSNLDYEPLDIGEIANEYSRMTDTPGGGNEDYLKKYVRMPVDEGFVVLRLLPRRKGQKLYCATRTHRIGADENGKGGKSFHCRRELEVDARSGKSVWRGNCVLCDYYHGLWQDSLKLSGQAQKDKQNESRKYKPLERYYYNCIVREQINLETKKPEFNVGPLIFSCGEKVHAKIMMAIVGDKTAGKKPLGDVTNPVSGRDFRVVKKQAIGGDGKKYPNYDQSEFEDVCPLGTQEEMEKWLNEMHDLQALRVVKDNDVLEHELLLSLGKIKDDRQTNQSNIMDRIKKLSAEGVASDEGTQTTSEAVREELVTPPTVDAKAAAKAAEEEIMADEDFLNDMDKA